MGFIIPMPTHLDNTQKGCPALASECLPTEAVRSELVVDPAP